jgi:hypothetical protein
MPKPITQGGAGATQIGPLTTYKRFRACRAKVTSSQLLGDKPPDPKPWETRSIAIFYALGDERDNYSPSPLIFINDIPELTKYSPSSIDDPEAAARQLFSDFVELVDGLNAENPQYDYRFEFNWEGIGDGAPPDPEINFFDLTFGTNNNSVEDNCFLNYDTPGPTTTFNGDDFSVGKYAFQSFGTPSVHEFKNTKNLIIQEKSFYLACCGDLKLDGCRVSDAISAFEQADLKDGNIKLINCKGGSIADKFALNCIANEIDLAMEDGAWTIGDSSFKGCEAKILKIGDGCETVGQKAFTENNFEHGISTFPASITTYDTECFKVSVIKSLQFPSTYATFESECFQGNKIEVGFTVNGSFRYLSFSNAIATPEPESVSVQGNVDGIKAFSNNNFYNLIQSADINADGAFYNSYFKTLQLVGNIYNRHAFYNLDPYNTSSIYLPEISKIYNSYRTFQVGNAQQRSGSNDFDCGLPCGAKVYFPKDPQSMYYDGIAPNFDTDLAWDEARDRFAFSKEEAIAFSKANPTLSIEWTSCTPKEITVQVGNPAHPSPIVGDPNRTVDNSWTTTLRLREDAIIPDTNSTIGDAFDYYKFNESGPENNYQDQYYVGLTYHPWGGYKISIMGDPELTDNGVIGQDGEYIPDIDSEAWWMAGRNLLAEGRGFWEMTATGTNRTDQGAPAFAQTSKIYFQGELINPLDNAFTGSDQSPNLSVNTDADPGAMCKILSYVPADNNQGLVNLYADLCTRQQFYWLQQLNEFIINGKVDPPPYKSVRRLYVPADQVDILKNDSVFRNQHMFNGEILPIPGS